MATVFFTKNTMNISGTTFTATDYTTDAAGNVIIEIELNGRKYAPVKIGPESALYEAAAAFIDCPGDPEAEARREAFTEMPIFGRDVDRVTETIRPADDEFLTVDPADAELDDLDFLDGLMEEAAPAPKAPRKDRKPAALDPAKAARGPVPAKDFIGTEITGRGWRILFDGEENRTRVIFEKCPTKEVRQIVKDAGFYWSPAMGSWNKKLTFKAYRAALELAKALQDVRRIAA